MATTVLLFQAIQKIREQYDLLANCLYIGSLRIPTLEAVVYALGEFKGTNPTWEGLWFGHLIMSLWKNGYVEEAEGALSDAVEFGSEESNRDLGAYLEGENHELFKIFSKLVPEYCAAQQESSESSENLG